MSAPDATHESPGELVNPPSQASSASPSTRVTARKYDPRTTVHLAMEAKRAKRRVPYDRALDPYLTNKALAQTVDHLAFEGQRIVADARYEDIARRLWMQQSVDEIATAHNVNKARMREIMRDPAMIAAYLRVKADLFADLDKTLFDEAAAPLLRARMQSIRAQTLLSEVIEEVRTRMQSGQASATTMKVGVDAAFGIMDRSNSELALKRPGGVQVNVGVATGGAGFRDGTEALIRNTIAEAGLDLSDLAAPRTIDVDAHDASNAAD